MDGAIDDGADLIVAVGHLGEYDYDYKFLNVDKTKNSDPNYKYSYTISIMNKPFMSLLIIQIVVY